MKFSIKKEFGKGFAYARQKEWKCCQLQTRLVYRTDKDVKAREFASYQDAFKHRQGLIDRGYKAKNIFINKEVHSFIGVVCNTPRQLYITYYSKDRLNLVPEQHGLKNELKALSVFAKPHLNKPTEEEKEKFKEGIDVVKSSYYSPKPVCNF